MPTTAPPAGTTGLTYADLLELPEPTEAGGERYELLDGELLVTPSPRTRHQDALVRISAALLAWSRSSRGRILAAPMDVWFDDRTILQPDVLAVTADHLDRLEERRVVGPPDLAVEISSPSTRRTDLVRKRRVYEREGVPEFWFVDLDADQVQVHTMTDGGYGPPTVVLADGHVTSTALPGMTMPAAEALALEDG